MNATFAKISIKSLTAIAAALVLVSPLRAEESCGDKEGKKSGGCGDYQVSTMSSQNLPSYGNCGGCCGGCCCSKGSDKSEKSEASGC